MGSYPEELLAVAPGGLPSWDDVRVRYDYYKKRGYLRGLYKSILVFKSVGTFIEIDFLAVSSQQNWLFGPIKRCI